MGRKTGWKREFQMTYGVQLLSLRRLEQFVSRCGVLWTTRCCATKRVSLGSPEEMYDSYLTRFFYRFTHTRHVPFAILSDEYGLHFSDERLAYYDRHPSALSPEQKRRLGCVVREKAVA